MSRFGYVMTTYLVTLLITITSLFPPSPKLLWNASASIPTGFYILEALGRLKNGEVVAVRPPAWLADFLDTRHYLPKGLPLLKHIGALPGQTVCRRGQTISIDGNAVAVALARDHAGRPLPVWNGCRTLAPQQVFLLNPTVRDSFDGRYFGALPMASLIGRAAPLLSEGNL